MSLATAVGDAAEWTQSHLLFLTVEQPVLFVTGTGPSTQLLGIDQQVSWGPARLLQVRLDMNLAAGLLTAQTDLPHRQRGASSAENTVQHSRDFLCVQRVEPLHDVGKLEVLLQRRFLVVVVVALGAANRSAVFGPGLGDATLAEVVLARQLDGLLENIQTNWTQKLFFEAVFPT